MDNFEKPISEMPKAPERVEPMVSPVEKPDFSILTEAEEEKPKTKDGTNIFMAVLISVVIILLLSVAGWFLARKYIWQPQQSYVENQFKTLDVKIQDLSANLEAEKAAAAETMEVLKEMEAMLEDMKMEEEPSEIEVYMMEEFEVPADWQTYKNDDWGIEFQYPADWEALEVNDILGEALELWGIGEKELRDNWVGESEGGTGLLNPYSSKIRFSSLEELALQDLENNDNISELGMFNLNNSQFYSYINGSHGGIYYLFYIDNQEGLKYSISITYPLDYDVNVFELDNIKTELNILKTLKFTK